MVEAQVGQRYKRLDAQRVVWEVIAVRLDLEGVRHCRIVEMNNRSNEKLISEKTLTNRKFYLLVS
ncbi:MAG: hypothetical protein ACM3O6_13610 [Acidobacteriota bacterium]